MPSSPLSTILRNFLADLGPEGGETDGELLARFLCGPDDTALAALVRRHALMVWGVCRRLLRSHHDAEDAFQATFLVLVKKAASVPRQAVAGWLHAVARQTAVRLRATAAKRGRREAHVMTMPEPTAAAARDSDLAFVLDEELGRLLEHYRGALVLCDLEGRTRREAARQLGIPEGSVASRLARARAMLARRLSRRGIALSGGSGVAALGAGTASASAPPALVASTIRAASLLAAGQAAGVSAKVAALTEGTVKAMLVTKIKGVLAVAVVAGVFLAGAAGLHRTQATEPQKEAGWQPAARKGQRKGLVKPAPQADKLVGQLGSESFADREAAEKALVAMGARAAAAVGPRMGDADLEVARRCARIWPRLWQAEMDRKDADRLAGYPHPLWLRFRKVAGDDPGSRTLFAEMVADFEQFRRLEAALADPKTAAAAYTAGGFPTSGIPTRGEFVTLLFLGTYPATAKDEGAANTHNKVLAWALRWEKPPALRRLYGAWLGTRTDPQPIANGLNLAVKHSIAEVFPTALAHAANARLAPGARGFALLAVGRFGTAADLPVLKKAFLDSRVFHTSKYTELPVDLPGRKEELLRKLTYTGFYIEDRRRIEVRVSDAAVAAALRLSGQDPCDFGFTFQQMYKRRGPGVLAAYYLLGFFQGDDAARQAAHKKAREWLDKHGKGKPRQQP
jgi:RNA polymerase sigma factor (sigma-70 family)